MESLLDGTHFVMEAMTIGVGPKDITPSNTFVTRNGPGRSLILAPPDRIPVERQGWKAESAGDGKFYIVSISGPGGFSWEGDRDPTPNSFVILDEPKLFARPTLVPGVEPPIGPVGWLRPIITNPGVEYYVGRNESNDKLQYHSHPVAPPFETDQTVWKLIPMAM